jgi:hypothetical protein
MRNRVGVAALLALSPGLVQAQQGIAIDHKEVSCIVAGKFPKMNACFAPNADVARARVYFRPEGVTTWYYVEMKSDAPCLAGILPRPRKELVDKHINYYVHVTDKKFTEARTLEYNPLVVSNESECKDKPVGPYLTKAAVKVFPSLPGGFAAGGLGTAGAVGIGAGVAGAAAGGAAIASNNNDTNPTTTTLAPTTTQPTQTTTTTTTPTTTTPTQEPFKFVFKISPNPPKGVEPLEVTVDMCASTPNGGLRFFFNFDGGLFDFQGSTCSQTRTLTTAGVSGSAVDPPLTTLADTEYEVTGCAQPKGKPEKRECETRIARVIPDAAASSLRITPFQPNQTAARRLAWNSELDVDGGAGQVVANGSAAVFAGKGRSTAVAMGRRGDNRIEAQLVQGSGRAGTWRFDLTPTASLQAGSLRVISGEVAQVSGDAIVFRLKGQPGERIVFTFKTGK